jgi:hypothetical protein
MKNATIELADVVRQFRDEYAAQFGQVMMPSQRKALEDIARCMTVALGGHRYRCCDCGDEFWICHGCRNRSCPKCHGRQMQDWLDHRRAELLPCDYFHLVATVPEELRHAFLSDQKFMYSLLMKIVAGVVADLAKDSKRVGAVPGILMVLHTWTAQMSYHPHVHLLVTAGGVTDDGLHWRTPPGKFLVPVKALSRVIAARFRDALARQKPHVFCALPKKIWRRAWCSYCQHYGHGKDSVLRYLGRYVFRIALTNTRILDMDDTHITFRYKDRQAGRWRTCRLTGVEFLRRFLMHVLPKGFHKVRYYGLWHPSKRSRQLRARLLLMLESPAGPSGPRTIADLMAALLPPADESDATSFPNDQGFQPRCRHCGSHRLTHLAELPRVRGP